MKVVFLDRDGTINVDHGYVHRVEDWRFTERAIDAIRRLRTASFRIAVVTNQSAVAGGRYSVADILRLHEFVARQLEAEGAQVDTWVFCPHARDAGCECRKPRIGMAHEVERRLGGAINYSQSWMVGDKPSDVEFGQTLGMATVLLTSRYWTWEERRCEPTIVAGSLAQAADIILGETR